jgi:Spy/CpxP family protein refolding chaperone
MKKGVTSVRIAVVTLLLCSISMFGQAASPSSQSAPRSEAQPNPINDKDVEMLRADLREKRKELMARNMNLTADEATRFWPIFDQYRKEAIVPNDARWALIKEYAANYNTMTDTQARDYMKRATAVDQELVALRQRYIPVFERVIPAKKTALWYQIDRHIDLIFNLHLSSMIPMMDTTK